MSAEWAQAGTRLLSATMVGTSVALLADLLLRCVPRTSSRVRWAVWAGAMLFLVLLPLLHRRSVGHSGAALAPAYHVFVLSNSWLIAMAAVWATLSLARTVLLMRSIHWVRVVLRRAVAVRLGPVSSALVAGALLSRKVEVRDSADVQTPCVVGFFRPCVLLPQGLATSLSDHDIQRVLQHELEHVRRWDDWSNLLQKVLLVLFPLHLGIWLADRRLCAERESACDESVVRRMGAPKAYALCLANLAEYSTTRSKAPLALAAWERRSELAGRIQRILDQRRSQRPAVPDLAVACLLGGLLFAGMFGLARVERMVGFSETAAPQTANAVQARDAKFYAASVAAPRSIEGTAPSYRVVQRPKRAHVHQSSAERISPPPESTSGPDAVLVKMDRTVNMRVKPAVWIDSPGQEFAAIPVSGGWLIVRL